ncbi:hypothetical protein HDU98_011707 [Podochytrium sp. JEL0797]|nr:hypothetical protein HDU98_011707 [Podochytrium sp. JEL0797]
MLFSKQTLVLAALAFTAQAQNTATSVVVPAGSATSPAVPAASASVPAGSSVVPPASSMPPGYVPPTTSAPTVPATSTSAAYVPPTTTGNLYVTSGSVAKGVSAAMVVAIAFLF